MKRTLFFRCITPLCLPALAMPAIAAVEIDLGVTSRYSDNARRTYSDKISERQDGVQCRYSG
jgi:hypothetical protein